MSAEIKSLIEKINREGIQAAEEKGRVIEAEARMRAEQLMTEAKQEAERLLTEGKSRLSQAEQKQRVLLEQAGRDFLLALRAEIEAMLLRVVRAELCETLKPELLAKLLLELAKRHETAQEETLEALLGPQDALLLQDRFLSRLQQELKRGILLRPREEISGGFTISFDGNRSSLDFSDAALADYICRFLKPKLTQLLREAVLDRG